GGDLSARAPADGAHARRGDEISELTRAFNEMAERVERLVRSEKDLLANVSHELRSPLASIRVALGLLLREAGGDARRVRDGERVGLGGSAASRGGAPADRQRVFEPFYRGDAARTPDPGGDDARRGVALGLTLASRIAEVHGGAIAIGPASEAGGPPRGCRVVLTIPLSS